MKRLRRRCDGKHKHIQLMSGKAKFAATYPKKLCAEVCRGLKDKEGKDFDDSNGWLAEILEEKRTDSEVHVFT